TTKLSVSGARGAPLGEVVSVAVELLDAVVAVVANVDIACEIRGHRSEAGKLSVARAGRSPLRDVVPRGIELLDSTVAIVRHVDESTRGGNTVGSAELRVAAAGGAPLRDVVSGAVELLNPVAAYLRDIDGARGIDGDAGRKPELPIAAAQAAPLADEV